MKALELANKLEYAMESHDGSSLSALCQGIADDAATELRRLAEVNAELVEALGLLENAFIVHTNWNGEPIAEVHQATAVRAKAKEQQ